VAWRRLQAGGGARAHVLVDWMSRPEERDDLRDRESVRCVATGPLPLDPSAPSPATAKSSTPQAAAGAAAAADSSAAASRQCLPIPWAHTGGRASGARLEIESR